MRRPPPSAPWLARRVHAPGFLLARAVRPCARRDPDEETAMIQAFESRRAPQALIARIGLGASAGLVGGVMIWIYEALVWGGAQYLLTIAAIPANATGLVLGKAVQASLGPWAYVLGTMIHFAFAAGVGRWVRAHLASLPATGRGGHAGGPRLCDRGLDRHACGDRRRRARTSQLSRPGRGDRRFHVAL